jgi:hypothetical protein
MCRNLFDEHELTGSHPFRYGGAIAMHASAKSTEIWQISSTCTAQRLLAIAIGLRSFFAVQSLSSFIAIRFHVLHFEFRS